MAYVSDWERLLTRPTASWRRLGCSKDQAQTDICRAIADGAIKIRCELGSTHTRLMTAKYVLEGKDFQIPTEIKPAGSGLGEVPSGETMVRPARELFAYRDTGTWSGSSFPGPTLRMFCVPPAERDEATPTCLERKRPQRRSRPALERAKRAIKELYPEGVPGQAAVPNALLCRRVGEKLKEMELPDVSDDTILRAAGRAQIAQIPHCRICGVHRPPSLP